MGVNMAMVGLDHLKMYFWFNMEVFYGVLLPNLPQLKDVIENVWIEVKSNINWFEK